MKKFTEEQELQICDKYMNGDSSLTLAKEWKCDYATILNILKRNGVKRRSLRDANKKFSTEIEKEICNMYERGLSTLKIGEKYKCDNGTINRILRYYQVPIRNRKGENHPNWKGGISFEPYCELFNEEFKERVREFWGRKCGITNISEEENGCRLSVHHINYDKQTCCTKDIPLFIPLSKSMHAKTNKNRKYWEEMLTNYIMIWFDGQCFK